MRLSLFHLITVVAVLPLSNALADDPSASCPRGGAGDKKKNPNGVPYGTPDPKIKCALFRVLNPRTDTYKNFREDVDKGGLDADLIDEIGWPMIPVQQGKKKALKEGVGLDTQDLDGYVDGILSHKDLMWPHRKKVAELLKGKQAADGTVSAGDLYEAKKFTAKTFYDMDVTFGSYNEIPLIFLKCGGNTDTGRVPLKSVLEFFDGKPPSTEGRINSMKDIKKVKATIVKEGKPKSPSLLRSSKDKWGLAKFAYAKAVLVGKMQKMVLGKK